MDSRIVESTIALSIVLVCLNNVFLKFDDKIAIVAAVFPLIYLLRKTSFYRPVVVVGGSVLIGALAMFWFYERAFT